MTILHFRVRDGAPKNPSFSGKVSLYALHHLELFPVNKNSNFQTLGETEENTELAASITGPRNDLPVQLTFNEK
jgi:hypothetical protein